MFNLDILENKNNFYCCKVWLHYVTYKRKVWFTYTLQKLKSLPTLKSTLHTNANYGYIYTPGTLSICEYRNNTLFYITAEKSKPTITQLVALQIYYTQFQARIPKNKSKRLLQLTVLT